MNYLFIKRILKNKRVILGLSLFALVFLLVFCLSLLYPIDLTYQDVTQQNISPGFDMAELPSEMQTSPNSMSIGPVFSVGADQDGELHVWGKLTKQQKRLPRATSDIVQVSAGLDHMLALDEEGYVYTWGNNRFGLNLIPDEVTASGPIKQVSAGYQFSVAVSTSGELFFWGNSNLIELDMSDIPAEIQHHVSSVTSNSSNVIALLDDGSLYSLGRSSSPVSLFPKGETFTQVAAGDQAAVGLTTDGRVLAWGNDFYDLLNVPEEIQGQTQSLSAGRFHFTALLKDGSVVTWGRNQFGQTDVPATLNESNVNTTDVISGYFLNYAIDENGTVHPFGLKGYLMGTDGMGRDVFLRLIHGGRLTLTVGAIAVLISVSLGVLIGCLAGFYGGKVDLLLMRIAEITGAVPFLPLAMTLSVLIGSQFSETHRIILIMIILGLLSWPGMAQLVRGQILAEREKEFVLAARAFGIKERSIIFRHILPNILTPILICATMNYASSMLIESALSFLGFGVSEPNPTWGNMLMGTQSSQVIANFWWRWVFPSIALCLTTVSISLIGDGLRDATDTRSF